MENATTKKTKYPGVTYDTMKNTYSVNTTFKTLDGRYVKKGKRGFTTAKKANEWKEAQKVMYQTSLYSQVVFGYTEAEQVVYDYVTFKGIKSKPTTITNTKNLLKKYFADYFKDENISKLNINDINKYYYYLSNLDLKNQSKNQIIIQILGLMEWLDLNERIPSDINRKFKAILVKFNTTDSNVNFLEKAEITKILEFLENENNKIPEINKLIFKTFIYSGLRRGELLALQYKDINKENNTIHVYKQKQDFNGSSQELINFDKNVIKNSSAGFILPYTKTNSIKYVIIPQNLVDDIYNYQKSVAATDDDFIFINYSQHKKILSGSAVNYIISSILKKAGVEHIRVHDLRHTYTTMLYDLGVDASFVKQQLGHSTESTSKNIYDHVTKERAKKNKEIIENLNFNDKIGKVGK